MSRQVGSDAFKDMSTLSIIDLSQNKLLAFLNDSAFSGLNALTSLDLSGNDALTHVGHNALPPSSLSFSLQQLYLHDSGLTSLDENLFNDLFNLKTATVHNTAIRCDCDVAWVSHASRDGGATTGDWFGAWLANDTAARCRTPDNFNQTIVSLQSKRSPVWKIQQN